MTRLFIDGDDYDDLPDDGESDVAKAEEAEDEEPERLPDDEEEDDFDEDWDADFEPLSEEWFAETLEIKRSARTADGPDFADADEEEETNDDSN